MGCSGSKAAKDKAAKDSATLLTSGTDAKSPAIANPETVQTTDLPPVDGNSQNTAEVEEPAVADAAVDSVDYESMFPGLDPELVKTIVAEAVTPQAALDTLLQLSAATNDPNGTVDGDVATKELVENAAMPFTLMHLSGTSLPVLGDDCTTVGQLRASIAESLGAHVLQIDLMKAEFLLEDLVPTSELEGVVSVLQKDFVISCLAGHWANTDASTGGYIGCSLGISSTGQLRVAKYGKCHPSWSVCVFDAAATDNGFQSKADHGFMVEMVAAKLEKDGMLHMCESTEFRDSRAPQEHTYIMSRVLGSLDDMEAHLTSTFYTPNGEPGLFSSRQRANMLKEFE